MVQSPARSDVQIRERVIKELGWDRRVEEANVRVDVDQGVVTLAGAVDSYAKRAAAEAAAHRVAGVLDVANDIEVRPPGEGAPSDTEIARALRSVLESDAYIPSERIQTTVSGGWVTLEGSVDYLRQRLEVERLVRRQRGVRGVTDAVVVHAPAVDPEKLREAIREALERRAEREARDLMIEVENGTVLLDGHVRSWQEKRAVVGAISHAPGVHRVEDRLKVNPHR